MIEVDAFDLQLGDRFFEAGYGRVVEYEMVGFDEREWVLARDCQTGLLVCFGYDTQYGLSYAPTLYRRM